MKINRSRKLGDVGIRLKPNKPNLLENYTRFRKMTRKKKKRKKKKKKTVKRIEIHRKIDPFSQIIEDQESTPVKKDTVKEDTEDKKVPEIKKVKVQNRPQDLSESDPNVKKLVITASVEPDNKKKGSQIKLE